jgi:hypothetical protein
MENYQLPTPIIPILKSLMPFTKWSINMEIEDGEMNQNHGCALCLYSTSNAKQLHYYLAANRERSSY